MCGRDRSCSGDRCFYIAGIPVDGIILWRPGLEKVGEEMKQEMVWAGNSSPLHGLGFLNFDTDTVTSTP